MHGVKKERYTEAVAKARKQAELQKMKEYKDLSDRVMELVWIFLFLFSFFQVEKKRKEEDERGRKKKKEEEEEGKRRKKE